MIAYLNKDSVSKDEEVGNLRLQVKDLRLEARKEREALTEQFSQQITSLEEQLAEKNEEVRAVMAEAGLLLNDCNIDLYTPAILPSMVS